MKVPGFSAEAALYHRANNYWMSRTNIPGGRAVEPVFWRCWGNFCSDEWGYCIYRGRILM